jgi:hypothetical protein
MVDHYSPPPLGDTAHGAVGGESGHHPYLTLPATAATSSDSNDSLNPEKAINATTTTTNNSQADLKIVSTASSSSSSSFSSFLSVTSSIKLLYFLQSLSNSVLFRFLVVFLESVNVTTTEIGERGEDR